MTQENQQNIAPVRAGCVKAVNCRSDRASMPIISKEGAVSGVMPPNVPMDIPADTFAKWSEQVDSYGSPIVREATARDVARYQEKQMQSTPQTSTVGKKNQVHQTSSGDNVDEHFVNSIRKLWEKGKHKEAAKMLVYCRSFNTASACIDYASDLDDADLLLRAGAKALEKIEELERNTR